MSCHLMAGITNAVESVPYVVERGGGEEEGDRIETDGDVRVWSEGCGGVRGGVVCHSAVMARACVSGVVVWWCGVGSCCERERKREREIPAVEEAFRFAKFFFLFFFVLSFSLPLCLPTCLPRYPPLSSSYCLPRTAV